MFFCIKVSVYSKEFESYSLPSTGSHTLAQTGHSALEPNLQAWVASPGLMYLLLVRKLLSHSSTLLPCSLWSRTEAAVKSRYQHEQQTFT